MTHDDVTQAQRIFLAGWSACEQAIRDTGINAYARGRAWSKFRAQMELAEAQTLEEAVREVDPWIR